MKNTALSETKRVGKFGLIGILNTVIDFALFNVFINFGLYRIAANIISTTVAMSFSFVANKSWVFRAKQGNLLKQAGLFLLVTAFGLYIIQNLVIYFLTEVWLSPLMLGYDLVGVFGLDGVFSQQFVIDNGAKAVATLFSLVWNYALYKKVVFKK